VSGFPGAKATYSTAGLAHADDDDIGDIADLIAQGEDLFFNEEFGGNGRRCGTCHPATNNFTIDPKFIATLPVNDPLFVAEFNPVLAQLEQPALMREFGLILENVDGLEDPTNKFVMRGVPHTLALSTSLTQDPTISLPPAQMTGWSGDGAPGDGSLRQFAAGAVVQHFTKSLNRVEGVDFRLPNDDELDAMEAFQLSLGRQEDLTLPLLLKGILPNTGQEIFINGTGDPDFTGRCAACHSNAGALQDRTTQGEGFVNRNFNTSVENLPDQPPRLFAELHSDVTMPPDGGFGKDGPEGGPFGDGTFNTPPLVEAADSGPFFHNNVITTIEGAVDFYNSDAFNNNRGAKIKLAAT
jgi:mono/diheme cytochrome c family protein